ncbi:hybrid sensor histidine kinase/response regulator [Tepidibacter formicigenes]|jgi:nitrogen-specific signal transduction histidine kinase|uniref:Stage 0 sporulation protein A homolog n=1 Tax=Tepidibacter formicigenes DSM 15518 TaxID=1123349 RepID=A0A1M6T7E2_9FIRM|nr:ATP-binding protein [Tepidibacter formicigenes]SHK52824.1 Signal transduction histidine kinase [Tepidibacter formicigenes DSM 15518]
MSICRRLKFATKLQNIMILSTKLERDYSIISRYLNLILKKDERILIIVDKIYLDRVLENLKKYVFNLDKYIDSKKIAIVECEEFIEDTNLFSTLKKESLALGYEKVSIIGICTRELNTKIELIKGAIEANCEYLCYYNVLDLSIEGLLELSSYYKGILFEDEETVEIYSNKRIKELKLILESIQSSVKAKKNTYDNIKDLEKLNSFLTSVNKIKSLDDFLKNFLKLVTNIMNASDGGILTKSEGESFDIYYKMGKFCKCIENNINLKLNENELVEKINLKDTIMIFLNINEFTIIYLCFDKNKYCYQNKDILEIYVSSARNIVNAFLEKIKNDSIISQNEKLKALGEISNGVAHDFNNILASISGYVDLALVKNQDKTVRDYLEVIKRASLDGAEMLRRIQEFTKDIKEGDEHFFELDRIIKIALNMISPKIEEKCMSGIKININKDLRENANIKGREFEIREVIINILNNAIDAMPQGGDIHVRTYNIENNIFIEIEDTGDGIPKNILPRIFDPFFSTKGVNGNGIGLSVSYKIIKDHGGTIKVESNEGIGTKFIFSLPIELEEVKNIDSVNEGYNQAYCKVLVVDDKIPVAMATGEILKSMGKEVDICFSGDEALQKLNKTKFNLVISDLAMPNLNGIELAQKAKEIYKDIRFILMTGWLGDIGDYNSDTIDYILEKPFGIEEIKKILQMFN